MDNFVLIDSIRSLLAVNYIQLQLYCLVFTHAMIMLDSNLFFPMHGIMRITWHQLLADEHTDRKSKKVSRQMKQWLFVEKYPEWRKGPAELISTLTISSSIPSFSHSSETKINTVETGWHILRRSHSIKYCLALRLRAVIVGSAVANHSQKIEIVKNRSYIMSISFSDIFLFLLVTHRWSRERKCRRKRWFEPKKQRENKNW